MGALRLPRNASVVGLYILLALALLAPLASNTILPSSPDHANHTALVVEGKLALDEGQWPLRVAPFATGGLRYPVFQFYSQSPYLLAALIYKYVTPGNPWIALKLTYFLGLSLAAFFVFKLAELVGFDRTTAAITGVVYVSAPYLLINMYARAAYAEAFAQLVLPLIAYTSVRAIIRAHPIDVVWAALAWGVLGTSHIITFVYATLFFGVFAGGLAVARQLTIGQSARLLLPCLLGWGLAAFQWFPAATIHTIQHDFLGDPFTFRWLTPLSALLSFTRVPPEPDGRFGMTPNLHPAIGAPILVAVAGILYFRSLGPLPFRSMWVALVLFTVAAFVTWSPIQFWSWLPKQLLVVQFSYRLLTFTTVFGAILAAYFLWLYRDRYGPSTALPWLVGILALSQSYLTTTPANGRTLEAIIAAPSTTINPHGYEFGGVAPAPPANLPLVRLDQARQSCGLDGRVLKCTFNLGAPTVVQLPMLYYPTLLRITVNREPVSYFASPYMYADIPEPKRVVALALDAGKHRVFAETRGSTVGNAVSLASLLLLGLFALGEVMGRRLRPVARPAGPRDGAAGSTANPARS